MAVEKMQFSMPMAAGYEGFPFTATQAETAFTVKAKPEQEAPIVNAKLKKEAAIIKAKAEVEKQAAIIKAKAEVEKQGAIIKAKAEVEKQAALIKPTPEEAAFIALAARRGPGMAWQDEVDYSSEEDFDSDEDPEVSYSRICERSERRTRELFARMPWIKFEPDSSILKIQEDYEREQEELKRQMEEVCVVV